MSTEDQVSTSRDARARLWWSVPTACFLILLGLAMLFGRQENIEKQKGTSYDASSKGFRAAYLLLEELSYPVARSRRSTGGAARFVLSPNSSQKEAPSVDEWVRRGGVLILADDASEFAKKLGMNLKARQNQADPETLKASGRGTAELAPGKTRVEWPGQTGRVWARADDSPAITIYQRGRGEIWLLNMPELFDNKHLKSADNAILLCRLADDVLEHRPGNLSFDEYFHGLRDRPSVTELLFEPPALWITLQGLLLIVLVIGHYAPRFGGYRPEARIRRRSKEEFLDAMASLLERNGDYAAAYRTVHENLLRAIETALGLPPGTPPQIIVQAAVAHRGHSMEAILRPITTNLPASAGKLTFLTALNELEKTRDRFFDKRRSY
jgi:hypothetical protein